MRWLVDAPERIESGYTRARCAFLWFPKRCGNEYRWLQHERWEEKAHVSYVYAGNRTYGEVVAKVQWGSN